jgi:hypothetical protein
MLLIGFMLGGTAKDFMTRSAPLLIREAFTMATLFLAFRCEDNIDKALGSFFTGFLVTAAIGHAGFFPIFGPVGQNGGMLDFLCSGGLPAVIVSFVISGFCIHYSFVLAGHGDHQYDDRPVSGLAAGVLSGRKSFVNDQGILETQHLDLALRRVAYHVDRAVPALPRRNTPNSNRAADRCHLLFLASR